MFNIKHIIPLNCFTKARCFSSQASVMCKIKMSSYALNKNFDKIMSLQTNEFFITKISEDTLELTNHIYSDADRESDIKSLQNICNMSCKIYDLIDPKCHSFNISDIKFLLRISKNDRYISEELVQKYIADIFYDAAYSTDK
jgi:hypothetical protein